MIKTRVLGLSFLLYNHPRVSVRSALCLPILICFPGTSLSGALLVPCTCPVYTQRYPLSPDSQPIVDFDLRRLCCPIRKLARPEIPTNNGTERSINNPGLEHITRKGRPISTRGRRNRLFRLPHPIPEPPFLYCRVLIGRRYFFYFFSIYQIPPSVFQSSRRSSPPV